MGIITLENVRATSDITMKVRLKRQLTQEEVLNNVAVDNERFNLGLELE